MELDPGGAALETGTGRRASKADSGLGDNSPIADVVAGIIKQSGLGCCGSGWSADVHGLGGMVC